MIAMNVNQYVNQLALQGYNFIFVALPSSHQSLYEWLDFLEKNGEVKKGEIKKYEKGRPIIYRYKYVKNVPIREGKTSLMINWYEVEVIDGIKNKVIYYNSFITNHKLKEDNIVVMIKGGRTRWKVENEGNNILKNQGYNARTKFWSWKREFVRNIVIIKSARISLSQCLRISECEL